MQERPGERPASDRLGLASVAAMASALRLGAARLRALEHLPELLKDDVTAAGLLAPARTLP